MPQKSKNFGVTNHNPVDVHVGKQIKQARILSGMTQTDLADALKVTFQQVQKYERGANRVSASRLWDLSQILKVEIGFFFDNMNDQTKNASPRLHREDTHQLPEDLSFLSKDPIERRESLELLRHYYLIKSPTLRKKMARFIKSASKDIGKDKGKDIDEMSQENA